MSPPVAEQSGVNDGGEELRGRDELTGTARARIREWAAGEGAEVKSRGMVKKELIANYQAWLAHQN